MSLTTAQLTARHLEMRKTAFERVSPALVAAIEEKLGATAPKEVPDARAEKPR